MAQRLAHLEGMLEQQRRDEELAILEEQDEEDELEEEDEVAPVNYASPENVAAIAAQGVDEATALTIARSMNAQAATERAVLDARLEAVNARLDVQDEVARSAKNTQTVTGNLQVAATGLWLELH